MHYNSAVKYSVDRFHWLHACNTARPAMKAPLLPGNFPVARFHITGNGDLGWSELLCQAAFYMLDTNGVLITDDTFNLTQNYYLLLIN